MANIKVSEMTEATSFEDDDLAMIVQSNQNKKITRENMLGDVENDISNIQEDITDINTNIGDVSTLKTIDTTDIVSGINSIMDAEVYSITEINTGMTWVDGNPIYRKIYDLGTLPNNNEKLISLNINNLKEIIYYYGIIHDASGGYQMLASTYASGTSLEYTNQLMITNATSIRVRTWSDRTAYSGYAIVEYTKTTD